MIKYEDDLVTTTVTDKKLKIEIPIKCLVNAFEYYPDNYCEAKVKRGKRQQFANYLAKAILQEIDQDTGNNLVKDMFDRAFEELLENGDVDTDEFIRINDDMEG